MSKRPRRNHTASFKAKVALAAVKGRRRSPSLRGSLTSTQSDHPVESPASRRRSRGVRQGEERSGGFERRFEELARQDRRVDA